MHKRKNPKGVEKPPIEKNKPLPNSNMGRPRKYELHIMEIGDSIYAPKRTSGQVQSSIRNILKYHKNWKFQCKAEITKDESGSVTATGVRIFRIK